MSIEVLAHVCTHYPAPQGVHFISNGDRWRRVKATSLVPKGWHVLKCSQCDQDAAQVDHLYPYYSDYNLCREHMAAKDARP